MGNRWRKHALLLLLVLFLLQVVQSISANDSARMQETAGENKTTTISRSSGGGSHGEPGGSSGGGGSRGEPSGSSGNGGEGASDGTSYTPDGRVIPLVGGGLAAPRNGANAGHRRHNAASSTYSCSLPIVLTSTALGALLLAL